MFYKLDALKKMTFDFPDAFYLVNHQLFSKNFDDLLNSFKKYYEKTNIAYSYKTNYIPRFCKIIEEKGGLAEVVSDMECRIAYKLGVDHKSIVFNGPYKNEKFMKDFLINGGTVNIDSTYELDMICSFADENPNIKINVGIRCNYDVLDGIISRFGFDIDGEEFSNAILNLNNRKNINIKGLHAHFASRDIETWKNKVKGMLALIENKFNDIKFENIDLGGGLYGNMSPSLKEQFTSYIPTFEEYAEAVAKPFAEFFANKSYKPTLLIEPGSALVGDAMNFVSRVINIKNVRGKYIATLTGSMYNINPTLNKKNPPIEILNFSSNVQKEYSNLDFAGFTCIESDYLYRGYHGKLAIGDYVYFENVGSYSVVLKPPFILPNYPIIEYFDETSEIRLLKPQETFEDIFNKHRFNFGENNV